eukprot:TRINITY_DN6989_c1_g2_i1.p1 TRINITY_DN6989_c1_g2~~TRINITY_DN6989_c1_g2_i1.p1  ORF type:complete len:319 (+),score=65.28 TRINITY_DN6989_c1_g2_i1:61-1017(+)
MSSQEAGSLPEKRRRTEEKLQRPKSVYEDTNGVPRAGNPPRVLHLGLTDGEVAGRICVVGHPSRAELLSNFLKPEVPGGSVFKLASDRGFLTFTGLFEGERVSVVSIGMGLPMMDFFVREVRAVIKGPMSVVRLGTCGCLQEQITPGTMSVASTGAVLVQRNYGHFHNPGSQGPMPYLISEPCEPDKDLNDLLASQLKEDLGADQVHEGMNATADSFYGAQGRIDPAFHDDNAGLVDEVLKKYPQAITMEMETFQLLHLARSCRPKGNMRAAAAVVNVANRTTGDVVGEEALRAAEKNGGKAILKALVKLALTSSEQN